MRKTDNTITLIRKENHIAKDKIILIMHDNWIRNNPITVGDVPLYHKIYGPPFPSIKGRNRYDEIYRIRDF